MKTYLLTWNPNRSPEPEMPRQANETAAGKTVIGRWSCGNTKQIEIGDRVFLIRLGVEPKGIVGSGWVVKPPYFDTHWDVQKQTEGKKGLFVMCEWERILNPTIDVPLSINKLPSWKIGEKSWTPQSSGVQIPSNIVSELENLWAKHIGASSLGDVFVDDEISAFEGEERIALIRHRKREQKLRGAKLKHTKAKNNGRLVCEVSGCGFEFEKVYGELGKDFAHVHHLKPIGDRNSPSLTSLDDLAIVCANCHAMIHKGGKCRPLEGLICAP
jgi:5-methylcytosine-specific restriction protein A